MQNHMTECPICKREDAICYEIRDRMQYKFICKNCTEFFISQEVIDYNEFSGPDDAKSYIMSGICRQISEQGTGIAEIYMSNIKDYLQSSTIPKDVLAKIDRLLTYIGSNSNDAFTKFTVGGNIFPSVAFLRDDEELIEMLDMLSSDNILDKVRRTLSDPPTYKLTMKGIRDLATKREKAQASTQAFIAMWFDNALDKALSDAIEPAIRSCGYNSKRIDKALFNNKICDEIISSIRSSRFIVADFTGNRGGVYFEAGYALGMGIPVIYTCRKDWFDSMRSDEIEIRIESGDVIKGIYEHKECVHFDVNHYNFIVWEDIDELKEKLMARISATVGAIEIN